MSGGRASPCLGGGHVPWTGSDQGSFLAQLLPSRPPVRKLLETLREWLASLPLDRIPYHAVLDLVNNKMRVSPAPPPSSRHVPFLVLCLYLCRGP